MKAWFKKDLEESGYLKRPLRIHYEEMRETRDLTKKVIKRRLFDDMTDISRWETVTPEARIELSKEHTRECEYSLRFSSVTKLDHWPRAFGRIYEVPSAVRVVNDENWEDINRISFWVYPDMPGFHSICLRMQFHNGGDHPVPDRYDREGHHNVNLVNGKWQYVSVEIPYVHRDHVTGISFDYDMVGSEPSATKEACWYITDIYLETLDPRDLDVYEGWQPGEHRIALSQSGYLRGSEKTAVINEPGADSFKVVETATGRTVLKKAVENRVTVNGQFQVLDFSELTEEGEYLIVCGDVVSRVFSVDDGVFEDSIWKVLNFLLCERCGVAVPGKHYLCHADSYIWHGDMKIVANGGWHDAGDMTQTTTNTSECTYALFELLDRVKGNRLLYDRVMEEAKWGLEWVLKTRFGDGYRVPSCSKSCWTDNILGTDDDIFREAAYETIENFMCAGAEALASIALREDDPILSDYSLKCAIEDWKFGYAHKDAPDKEPLDDGNRIYTPLLKYAAAGWSAADLYRATGDPYFKEMLVWACDEVMACQQREKTDWDVPVAGFFYDDKTHALIAHCSHRCHDNEPIKALAAAAELFPEHEKAGEWLYAIRLYTEYLQWGAEATAPFNALPASIYQEDEAFTPDDYDMGMIRRYLVDEERKENYKLQVQQGVPLGKGYYLRRMPVAFEHRGNHGVPLSGGKALVHAARLKGSVKDMDLAAKQLEWILGRNPFAESVMFGEGYDYCSEYAVLPGEMVGELGVGFACLDEHDSPFWPQVNTCVYKEVWIRTTYQCLHLAADLYGASHVYGLAPGAEEIKAVREDGTVYTAPVNARTGEYCIELPMGRYMLECGGQKRPIRIMPAKQYLMDAPFAGIAVTKMSENEYVLRAYGENTVMVKTANAVLTGIEGDSLALKDGEEIRFTVRPEKAGQAAYAAFIPNGEVDALEEIYLG